MGRFAFALAALALACGGTQHGNSQKDSTAQVKQYKPLEAKVDAKTPNRAVILGTDDRNGSTVIVLPDTPTKVMVDAMWVKIGGPERASGGSTPVKLSTAPNPDQEVQVTVGGENVGGTGAQWNAGVWVASIIAAWTLDKDLTDFTFTASSSGYIDGPSASGLMAAGFLAAMTGQAIDPKVTMTGIINPDGTIGPVGGIPEKFLASIEKGKKKLGFPIGMRYTKSEASGQIVDLIKLAKDHDAEAIEIADVHEAYKLITGKALPAVVPVSEADMAFDPDTVKSLERLIDGWQQKLAAEWATILQLDSAGQLPGALGEMRDLTKKSADESEKMRKAGKTASAYAKILSAWVYATATTETADIIAKVTSGDGNAAIDKLAALDRLDDETTKIFQKIGAMKANTLGGHLQMMSSFKAALRAWGFKTYADDSLGKARRALQMMARDTSGTYTPDQIAAAVAPTVILVNRTLAETTLATQELEFESEKTVNYMCSLPNVKRMAKSFQSAARAGLAYFDALLRIDNEYTRQMVALREPEYLVATMTAKMAEMEKGLIADLKKQWGEKSLAWGLANLAGSELAYYASAALIAKYYSLSAHLDASGKVDKVEHDKAFSNMLASAERAARSNARAARIATGGIPVQAKLSYELAMSEKDGAMDEKIDALAQFWASSAMSQSAVMLARN
jgi:hypothetical protein